MCCVRVGQFGIKKWWAVRLWDTVYRNGGQCEGGAFLKGEEMGSKRMGILIFSTVQ